MMSKIKATVRWTLMAAAAVTMTNMAGAEEGTIEVKVGENVERSYASLKADGYAYAHKQKVEGEQTHIWLPYGTKGVYYGNKAVKITDVKPGSVPLFQPGVDGHTPVKFGYKLHFDKPIAGFTVSAGWVELGLKNAVAGLEYSTDGQQWVKVKEVEGHNGIIDRFMSPKTEIVTGLKTQDLYLRFYSRAKGDPDASYADSAWFKMRLGGDPSWGDASSTFFANQIQIWVTAAQ